MDEEAFMTKKFFFFFNLNLMRCLSSTILCLYKQSLTIIMIIIIMTVPFDYN